MRVMTRTPIAILTGLIGFFFYLAAVLAIGDHVQHLHWAIQAVYFVIAGSIWVMPIRWLMLWAAHRR